MSRSLRKASIIHGARRGRPTSEAQIAAPIARRASLAIGGVVALETVDASDLLRPGQTLGARVKTGYQDANGEWMGAGAVYGLVNSNSR